jgi:hypothetical protein
MHMTFTYVHARDVIAGDTLMWTDKSDRTVVTSVRSVERIARPTNRIVLTLGDGTTAALPALAPVKIAGRAPS